jgi:hypothetical protein
MTENDYQAAWTVDSQTQRTRADSSGNVRDGYDVSFHTGEGHYGTVFVTNERYSVQNVAAAVQEAANKLDAVGSLSSGM